MALKHVVFPAPFGPIRPKICPGSMSRLTWSSAVRPPKRMVSSRNERSASGMLGLLASILELVGPPTVRHDALRPEDHHDHEGGAEHEHPVLGEAPEALGQ